MRIRSATLDDSREMLDIYRPYVVETAISFEERPPTIEEFRGRIAARRGKYPWLVCEADEELIGYAYAGEFRDRPSYRWTLESTVYVKRGHHRKGIGRMLYRNLLTMLDAQGAVNVIGGITLPNDASVKLHEAFGFVPVANFRDAGFKLGRWWDVGFWQLQFDKPAKPAPLRVPSAVKKTWRTRRP